MQWMSVPDVERPPRGVANESRALGGVLPIVYFYPEARLGQDTGRQSAIALALSRYTPVVFVETASKSSVTRFPAGPRLNKRADNLFTLTGAFGIGANPLGRRTRSVGRYLDGCMLRAELRAHGIHRYHLWLSAAVPEVCDAFRPTYLVYDCIDPCFVPSQDVRFDAAEREVASRADLVFATAEALVARMGAINPRTILLNNATDVADSKQAAQPLPDALRGRPRPIVGYLGTTDSRVDTQLLTDVATRLPEYTFCIAGRVNYDREDDACDLRALPNVVMPGPVSVAEGPLYNAAFDVGLIPFLAGDTGDAINPVKMYMYLSVGTPVVSTWIRESYSRRPLVAACRTVDEFVAAIIAARHEPPEARAVRIAYARKNTWDARARTAIEALRELSRPDEVDD